MRFGRRNGVGLGKKCSIGGREVRKFSSEVYKLIFYKYPSNTKISFQKNLPNDSARHLNQKNCLDWSRVSVRTDFDPVDYRHGEHH